MVDKLTGTPRHPDAGPATDEDPRIAADFSALRSYTNRDLPSWAQTSHLLQRQGEDTMMKSPGIWHSLSLRRRWGGALASVALSAGVLLWPISYERTVGHTVEMTVSLPADSGADPAAEGDSSPRGLARQMKKALGARAVRMMLQAQGNQRVLTLSATVPQRKRAIVEQQVAQLSQSISAQPSHPQVQTHINEQRQQVSGRVYAMALDRLIQVRVDTAGKTDAEVTAEVESQLKAQGIASPTVEFERHGDEKQLRIAADTGDRQVQVVRKSSGDSSVVEVTVGDIDTTREPGMTDDQLRDKILRQLAAKGLTATVTVAGDRIEIRAHHHVGP